MPDSRSAPAHASRPAHRRGRAVWDTTLGILILDTRFRRFPGDIGNGTTWPFPVIYQKVRGATPERVVDRQGEGLLDAFVAAAEELVDLGVDGITTTCGFLALFHPELVARLKVPVATTSLLQIPMVQSILPRGQRVGVLTFSAEALTAKHFAAVGIAEPPPVVGMAPDSLFQRALRSGDPEPSFEVLSAEVVAAAERLVAAHPDIGAIVSECTNMPPFAAAIHAATGRPVYDMFSLVTWFQSGLRPRRFA